MFLRYLRRRGFAILVMVGFLLLMGNVPAPYYACEGRLPGEPCQYGYGCSNNGACRLQKDCEDNLATEINECLWCETAR
jgi:hypothetical protein